MDGLDEQRLLGAAAAHWGVHATLEPEFQPALRALLKSLREEAELSQVGAWRAGARLLNALAQRAALHEFEAGTPDLSGHELDDPIFVTGLPRFATRLLHNLLARTPGLWAPRLWELQAPVAPPRITERWIDRRIRETEALLEQLDEAAPELRRLHPLVATEPDACSWLFRNNFSSLVHGFFWHVPSYVEFITTAELEPAYRDHRRWLRALAWRHRHDDLAGPRVVLEDAWHMAQLDALFRVYPSAKVIQVHGDPLDALPGLARTCWTLQRIDGKRARSMGEVADYCLELLSASLRANAAARERFGPARIIDVSPRALLDDPIALVRKLGRRLQLPVSEPALRQASRWLLDNRFALQVRPAPLESLGLDRRTLARRFADYRPQAG
ncbi:MAG: sulfotransferase [Enhygromyxa sp.]